MSKRKIPIVIFGDGITSFGVIRGLRDLDVDILMVSDSGKGIGRYSKYVKDLLILHPSTEHYVKIVIDWIRDKCLEKPLLMVAGNDDALELLSKDHEYISMYMVPTFPRWEIVGRVINKELMYGIATDIGVPIIKTSRISSDNDMAEFIKNSDEFRLPFFLKSSHSRRFSEKYKTKGIICDSVEKVEKAYRDYDGFMDALLVQELLPGDIDQIAAVLLVLNKKGKVIAVSANKKIRSSSLYGSTTLSTSMWDQKLVDHAVRLAEASGYIGVLGVQFKFDPRDNEYKFLEINGRFSVSVSLAQRCGINMPELVYKEFTGETIPRLDKIQQNYLNKILLWWPLSDIRLLAQKRFYRDPLRYLSSLRGAGYIIEPISWRDPLPAIITGGGLLLKPFFKIIAIAKRHLKRVQNTGY